MLEFKNVTEDIPIPAVDPGDIRTLLAYFRLAEASIGAASIAIDPTAQRHEFSDGFDYVATALRTAILHSLINNGSLDDWLSGTEPGDIVFEKVATYPLPAGLNSFNATEFVASFGQR